MKPYDLCLFKKLIKFVKCNYSFKRLICRVFAVCSHALLYMTVCSVYALMFVRLYSLYRR